MMNNQDTGPSIRYSAPEDSGFQIASEILKVLCIVLGVAAMPLVLEIFTREPFLQFAQWSWTVAAVLGLGLIIFGVIYSLIQRRRRRQYQTLFSPRQLLLDRLLPPFQVIVTKRLEPTEPIASASIEVQTQLDSLQSSLSGQIVEELLPPLGFHLFPDPSNSSYRSIQNQSTHQKKLDALKNMLQTGEIEEAEYQEMVQSLQQLSPEETDQKLQALKAMRDSGLMSRSVYKKRIKEIHQAASENKVPPQKYWLLLPSLLIAIGGCILIFALVAFSMEQQQVDSLLLITFYFSSPVFLLWAVTETLYAYPLFFIGKYRKNAHILGIIKSVLQIVAAIVLWFYLGLVFGIQNLDWLYYTGFGLAGVGLVLGIVAAILNGRLNNQPAAIMNKEEPVREENETELTTPDIPEMLSNTVDSSDHTVTKGDNDVSTSATPDEPLSQPLPQSGNFYLYQRDDDQFTFKLCTDSDENLLYGGAVATKEENEKLIQAIRQNAQFTSRYQQETTATGQQILVVLTDQEGRVLGQSPLLDRDRDASFLIASVQAIAFTATVRKAPQLGLSGDVENISPLGEPIDPMGIKAPDSSHAVSDARAPEQDGLDSAEASVSEEEAPAKEMENEVEDPTDKSGQFVKTRDAKPPKFQLFQGRDAQYYFRLIARNGEIILASEGYQQQKGALNGIRSVKRNSQNEARFVKKIAKNGDYFFTLQAGNHKVIGVSEMYTTSVSRDNGIDAVQRVAEMATVEIIPTESNLADVEQMVLEKNEPALIQSESMTDITPPKFQIFTGSNDQFYFHLMAGNHEIILASEGYKTKRSCENGVSSVRKNSVLASRFKHETSEDGQFYFSLTAGNHQVIGVSEMYVSAQNRDKGIQAVRRIASEAPLEDLTH